MSNEKLVWDLKCGLNIDAVVDAFKRGAITERQAKNLVTFIARARAIRERPIQTIVVEDQKGLIVGEINPVGDGQWAAQRYGSSYKRGGGTVFNTQEDAVRFVLKADSRT